jgi:ABC-type transporter Mla subunit MlaD
MSNDEFEKKAEFILEQQAQFAAKIGQLEDIIVRLAQGTLDRFEATDKRIDDIEERMSALVDSQIHTEEIVKETAENIKNLTAVVDRYFSEGRNGKSER